MNLMQQLAIGIALFSGLDCRQTEKEAPPKPEQTERIVITPLVPEKITRVECWTGSATYALPVEPVFSIVRRAFARGMLYPGFVEGKDQRQGRPRVWVFLLFDVPGRTALCSVRDDVKALTCGVDAMVQRRQEGLLREVSVSSKVGITYRMTDGDHLLLMRIIAAALGWDAPLEDTEDTSPKPGPPASIQFTPLFAEKNVRKVTYYSGGSEWPLPAQPISGILSRAVRRGAINEQPFKGLIFGWIVVKTPHREFKYRIFKVPEVVSHYGDGVRVRFRIDKGDHAQIVETVEAAVKEAEPHCAD